MAKVVRFFSPDNGTTDWIEIAIVNPDTETTSTAQVRQATADDQSAWPAQWAAYQAASKPPEPTNQSLDDQLGMKDEFT